MDGRLENLLDRLFQGSRVQAEDFVRRQYRGVFRALYWLSGDSDRAGDLTQETFMRFWGSGARFLGQCSARTWLYSIMRNVWREQFGRPAVAELDETGLEQLADPAPDPSELALVRERAELLRESVQQLAPNYREPLVLFCFEGLPHAEVADILGISVELCRWRVHMAKRQLWQRLKVVLQERKSSRGPTLE